MASDGSAAGGGGSVSQADGLRPLTRVTATRRVDTRRNEVSTSAACAPAGGRIRYCTCGALGDVSTKAGGFE